jgi:hypothetical protein
MTLKSAATATALSAAALMGFAIPAEAQQARAIPVQVQAGQTFLLDMDYSISEAGSPGALNAGVVLGLEIEEMGPQGGVWRWSIEDVSLVPGSSLATPAGAADPFAGLPLGEGFDQALSAGLRLMTDLDIVCRVDARGACVEVLNWPQWRERTENAVLMVTGVLRVLDQQQQQSASLTGPAGIMVAPDDKPAYVPSSRRGSEAVPMATPPAPVEAYTPTPIPFEMIARSVEAVAGVLLDSVDGRMLASLSNVPAIVDVQGLTVAQGQSRETETLFALPFGAEPFRMTGTVTLDSIDRGAGVARFSRSASLDSRGLTRSLTGLLQNGAPSIVNALAPVLPEGAMGEDPVASANFMVSMVGAAMASMTIAVQETSTAEVDLATGLVRSGQVRQVTSMRIPDGSSAMEQISRITFTLRPAPLNQPRLGAAAAQ